MILLYGRTCQITKSLFSLEFYGAFYKWLTISIKSCPDYPRCHFNRERVCPDVRIGGFELETSESGNQFLTNHSATAPLQETDSY